MWNAASTVVRRRTFTRAAHLALLLAVVVVPATLAVQTNNGGSATVQVGADADARVDAALPDANFGGSYLRVDAGSTPEESLVRFVVPDVGALEGATLRLHADSASQDGMQVYAGSSDWSESAVTWNTRPVRGDSVVADTGSFAEDTWIDFDVGGVVGGSGTYTFALVAKSSDGADFDSREMGSGPELILQTKGKGGGGGGNGNGPPKAPPGRDKDREAPTPPSNLAATGATQSSLSVSWSPSTDNVGVVGYDLYRDGANVGVTTETTQTLTGLACGSSYTVAVDATDAAGNHSSSAEITAFTSACSSALSSTTDTEPPTTPKNVLVSATTETTVTVSWSPSSDNLGVSGYGLYRDGVRVATSTDTSYVFAGLACGGSYTFEVDAFDAAGNRSARAQTTAATNACPSSPSASDSAFYVSPNGSDSNPGTLEAPWRTLGKAMATLSAGQTAYLRAGTYAEQTDVSCGSSYNSLTWARSGTSSAPITISGYPGEERQVVVRTKLVLAGSFLRLIGLVVDKNLSFSSADNACTGEPNLHVTGDDILLMRLEIRNSNMSGIYLSGADRATILRNWIHDNGTHLRYDHGIYFGSGGGLVANNVIQRAKGFGIQLYPRPSGVVVTQNTVVGSHMSGIVVSTSGGDITVANNILALNGQYGISYDSGSNCSADRNVLYGNALGTVSGGLAAGLVITTDPLFVDLPGDNLHLRLGSPAIDVALTALSRPYDFDGVPRPQGIGPDIGAYER